MELERLRQWVLGVDGVSALGELRLDLYGADTGGSLAPSGLTELERKEDVLGNVTVRNRLSLAVYFVMTENRQENAQWLLDFQAWVQEQCVMGLAPVFGEDQKITVTDAGLHFADTEGTPTYRVLLTAEFTRIMQN